MHLTDANAMFSSLQDHFEAVVTDDDINLVESQPDPKRAINNSTDSWSTFANVIDRFAFIVVGGFYLIAAISLLPEQFFDSKNVSSVQVVGY